MINLYCDESCHLEAQQKGMMFGAISVPTQAAAIHAKNIRALKRAHDLAEFLEMKWTKVSPARLAAYKALVDYFFDHPDLMFRAVAIRDKRTLNHAAFNQSYDDWYYKMYYELLRKFVLSGERCRIFVDIKDTRGARRVSKLREVLCNSVYDFDQSRVPLIQEIRSHEVQLMSLTDILIGALSYYYRGLRTSSAKCELGAYIQEKSGCNWSVSTSLNRDKFNLFVWKAQEL